MSTSGTKMYCPVCEGYRGCQGLNPSVLNEELGQRIFFKLAPDINSFQRARRCIDCGHTFMTHEVEERFILELIKLRDEIYELKEGIAQKRQDELSAAYEIQRIQEHLDDLKRLPPFIDIGDNWD